MGSISTLYFCVLSSMFSICQAQLLKPEKIDISLTNALKSQNEVDILVSFQQGTESALGKVQDLGFQSRAEKTTKLYRTLLANAKYSQNQTITTLTDKFPNTKVKSLWISNQIHIKEADINIIIFLSSLEDVSLIIKEPIVRLNYSLHSVDYRNSISNYQWGNKKIKAEEAWKMPGGNNGTGVVVGVMDTGVRGTHIIIGANYVGEYGWYDAYGTQMYPTDDNGHGTHVTGTIVGLHGIGVAPGAKWAACKAIRADGSGTASALLSCAEFFICPTTPQGTDPDCSKAPKIINNSWGVDDSNFETWFDSAIVAWHKAGIIPVFPTGNDGPKCNTVGYPAYKSNVITVGATTKTDELASFSSVGPTRNGVIKPDISAPGENIVSAWYEYDAITPASGTGMACAHVSGTLALLCSRNSSLTFSKAKSILENNVDKHKMVSQGATCGNISDSVFPNYHFGQGRLNAYKSLQAPSSIISESGPEPVDSGFSNVLPNVGSCVIFLMFTFAFSAFLSLN